MSSSESEFEAEFSEEEFTDPEDQHINEAGVIEPYMYEPEADSGDSDDGDEIPGVHNDEEDDEGRLGNRNWCSCDGCFEMPIVRESVCCKEIQQVVQKMDEYDYEANSLNCITEHPGFNTVCLDRWVLDTAYLQYRQQYGNARQDATENQKYRHTAYRQMPRWCWGFLGRNVRVPLPSCVVAKIREEYPSDQYKGFQEI